MINDRVAILSLIPEAGAEPIKQARLFSEAMTKFKMDVNRVRNTLKLLIDDEEIEEREVGRAQSRTEKAYSQTPILKRAPPQTSGEARGTLMARRLATVLKTKMRSLLSPTCQSCVSVRMKPPAPKVCTRASSVKVLIHPAPERRMVSLNRPIVLGRVCAHPYEAMHIAT